MSFLQKKKDFLFGLFFGAALIGSIFMLRSQPKSALQVDVQQEEVAKPKREIAAVKSHEENKPVKSMEIHTTLKKAENFQPEEKVEPAEPSRKQTISFSQHLVQQMEKEWSSLRYQAQLQSQPGGWRVLYVQPNSTFSQTGLQPGDFIRHEYVQQMRSQDDSQEQLSERVVRIFSYIE